jgi:hypothetical protein
MSSTNLYLSNHAGFIYLGHLTLNNNCLRIERKYQLYVVVAAMGHPS